MVRKAQFSREAAQEYSPRRKPWVKCDTTEPQRGERGVLTHTRKSRARGSGEVESRRDGTLAIRTVERSGYAVVSCILGLCQFCRITTRKSQPRMR